MLLLTTTGLIKLAQLNEKNILLITRNSSYVSVELLLVVKPKQKKKLTFKFQFKFTTKPSFR